MRKKLFTLALLLLVAAGSFHAYGFSAVTSSGHTLNYVIFSGTHNVEVQSSNVSGALVIDSTVTYNNITYRVTSIWYAFRGCTGLTSVTIPNSVTSIGNEAFYGCTGLTFVTIPNSVTSIGNEAFYGCTGLTSVIIPNTVINIGSNAFYQVDVVLYNGSATGSPWGALHHYCYYSDTTFLYADSAHTTLVGYIGTSSAVVIPNTVTNIGPGAFSGCTGLTSVTIPNSVTSIGGGAFDGCTGLNSVTIPNSVTSIGGSTFHGCTGLTSVTIPNSVTSIGSYAFNSCTGLTSVTIPNSVTSIGNYVFSGCTGLTSVTIPSSVTSIGERAFYNCTSLTSATIDNAATTIGSSAFVGCNALSSANIGNGVTSIGNYAFRGCSSLISIAIPNSTTEIGTSAFEGCTSLTSANIGDGVTTMGDAAFLGCLRLTSVSLGEGVVNIGSQAFKDCGIIGELVIPQSVTTIGSEGFRNCYGVNEITCLGRVAPSLGYSVFDGLDTSITVNIPCGTTNLYAGRWPYFHNFNEIPFLFKVATDNPAQGTAQMVREPSCEDPVAIVRATARNGYHFDHWSDGSTQNPYTCVVTGSMTLTAFFVSDSGPIGIEDVDKQGIEVYADGRRIVVTGAESGEVCLYDMMGRLAAKGHMENGSIIFDAPASGVYFVRIGDYPARRVVIVR